MPEDNYSSNPLAIVGEEDIILGFTALGFKPYPFKKEEDFAATLDAIVKTQTAVCLVQDEIYQARHDIIDRYRNLAFPIFIPFAKDKKIDLIDNIVKDIRLRATGAF